MDPECVAVEQARRGRARRAGRGCRGAVDVLDVVVVELGNHLAGRGTRREIASVSSSVKSTPASLAMARTRTVLVGRPLAHVRLMAVEGGLGGVGARQDGVVLVVVGAARGDARAGLGEELLAIWVARVVPLPGRARPMASLRQFA